MLILLKVLIGLMSEFPNFNVVLLLEISIIVYSSMMSIGLKMLIELISIFPNINAMTLKLFT